MLRLTLKNDKSPLWIMPAHLQAMYKNLLMNTLTVVVGGRAYEVAQAPEQVLAQLEALGHIDNV